MVIDLDCVFVFQLVVCDQFAAPFLIDTVI